MLAANQIQKRSRGLPFRAVSGIRFIPLVSTCHGRLPGGETGAAGLCTAPTSSAACWNVEPSGGRAGRRVTSLWRMRQGPGVWAARTPPLTGGWDRPPLVPWQSILRGDSRKGWFRVDESPHRHMHRIYTRRGDTGATATRGRARVSKDDPRVASYGTLYELNAHVGLALAALRAAPPKDVGPEWALLEAGLEQIQHRLFHVGRDLSRSRGVDGGEEPSTLAEHVTRLEALLDVLAAKTPPWKPFTLPGGAVPASHLFVATTVCRRAEREIVALRRSSPVPESVLSWVNRLSDLLFVAGRYVNGVSGCEEPQLTDPADGF